MTDVINDAEAYGVEIIPAQVEPGQEYWKVIRVHHLTPEENYYRHYIFLDAVDENGDRLYGTLFTVMWDGGSDTIIVDKHPPDPGTDFPMWKWQVCSVEALGAPSDRVVNLRTDHPKEGDGNDMFRHSFEVIFQRTTARESIQPASSVVSGRVPGGGGHTLEIRGDIDFVRTQVLGNDELYRFENLPAGTYVVRDLSDTRVAGPVTLNGRDAVTLDFPPVLPPERIAARYFLFGDRNLPETQLYLSLLSDYLAQNHLLFGFEPGDASQAAAVSLVGNHPQETVDALKEAGCQVEQLPLDPSELLKALELSQ
jgi:hypothetical protein